MDRLFQRENGDALLDLSSGALLPSIVTVDASPPDAGSLAPEPDPVSRYPLPSAPMRILSLSFVFALALSPSAFAGSDVPPEGPPWQHELLEAQRSALQSGTPVFCYFTKTY